MAVVNHLLIHTDSGGNTYINGVTHMLLAIEDTIDTTPALIRARGVTVANANGQALPPGYFDASRALTVYNVAGEHTMFSGLTRETVA
jgi:hypothetical protein